MTISTTTRNGRARAPFLQGRDQKIKLQGTGFLVLFVGIPRIFVGRGDRQRRGRQAAAVERSGARSPPPGAVEARCPPREGYLGFPLLGKHPK